MPSANLSEEEARRAILEEQRKDAGGTRLLGQQCAGSALHATK